MNAYIENSEPPPKSRLTCATRVLFDPCVITTVLARVPEALGSAAMDNATLLGGWVRVSFHLVRYPTHLYFIHTERGSFLPLPGHYPIPSLDRTSQPIRMLIGKYKQLKAIKVYVRKQRRNYQSTAEISWSIWISNSKH